MYENKSPGDFKDTDEMMDYLFSTGCIYICGVDDDGEFLIRTDMEVSKQYAPWWIKEEISEIDNAMTNLIKYGLAEPAGMTEDGEMTFGLTEAGEEYIRDNQ